MFTVYCTAIDFIRHLILLLYLALIYCIMCVCQMVATIQYNTRRKPPEAALAPHGPTVRSVVTSQYTLAIIFIPHCVHAK